MSTTFQVGIELATINCQCGGTYAITEKFREKAHETGGSWTCPYCKVGWGYANNNENSRLKRELAQLQTSVEHKEAAIAQLREQRTALERSRAALRGVHTRTCNRVKNGVCPCCNRTFVDLARHMETKHPAFKADVPA